MSSKKQTYFYIGTIVAVIVAFFMGMNVGAGRTPAAFASAHLTDVDKVSQDQFAPFWKAWQILDEKQVNAASTTDDKKLYGSIEGLASAYGDPYTVFFPPVEAKEFQEDISGSLEGVGMEIGIKNKQLQVISPIKGSPADKAGVKPGDLILKIGTTTSISMPVDEAVKLIRGPKGTTVKITFLPDGATKPVERSIVRDVISIPTIDTSTKPGGIFVIRLYSFTSQSADLFKNALNQFTNSGDHKLIIDLRGNPGGYLDAAWDIASWFLPSGKTVVTEDFGRKQPAQVYRSKGYDILDGKNVKIYVLVDGGSASASEILAGALEENGVAKLVGEKTFGKGSVQELIPLTSDTQLKVTIARWLTPNGHNLSQNGLDPDYPVTVDEKTTAGGADPVMEKAVNLLNQ